MSKLILSLNGTQVGEYPLDKDRITIGRRPEQDIHIDNLAISGEHAAIVSIYNYHFIEDLGSTNGTIVNDKEIKKQVLNHNDIIQLGKYELQYINLKAAQTNDLEKTVVIRPNTADGEDKPGEGIAFTGIDEKKTSTVPAWLEMHSGPTKGKRLNLTMASTTIGRQGSQLAVITRQSEGYYISSGGKTKPIVNGQPVDTMLLLQNGDALNLDTIEMIFKTKA
ncbi:MAG TPA: FHA domain-containing protein [Acidiferrobacteraceae bacterium]|nr:FHA domain-containing protein [Acidiferrobacteraceae bacterium]